MMIRSPKSTLRAFAAAAAGLSLVILASQAWAGDAAAGKKKARMCVNCHGLDGMHRIPNAANIGGETVFYLTKQLKAFRSGERKDEQMSIIAKSLSDEDIANLAAWYSSIKISAQIPQ